MILSCERAWHTMRADRQISPKKKDDSHSPHPPSKDAHHAAIPQICGIHSLPHPSQPLLPDTASSPSAGSLLLPTSPAQKSPHPHRHPRHALSTSDRAYLHAQHPLRPAAVEPPGRLSINRKFRSFTACNPIRHCF